MFSKCKTKNVKTTLTPTLKENYDIQKPSYWITTTALRFPFVSIRQIFLALDRVNNSLEHKLLEVVSSSENSWKSVSDYYNA